MKSTTNLFLSNVKYSPGGASVERILLSNFVTFSIKGFLKLNPGLLTVLLYSPSSVIIACCVSSTTNKKVGESTKTKSSIGRNFFILIFKNLI